MIFVSAFPNFFSISKWLIKAQINVPAKTIKVQSTVLKEKTVKSKNLPRMSIK